MRRKIFSLVSDGLYKEAISYHAGLHSASSPSHHFTFPPLLKACANLGSLLHGALLHSLLIRTGFRHDAYTATSLAHMYMVVGRREDALKVFEEMPERNLATANAVISGLSRSGFLREALLVVGEVRGGCDGGPNSVTIASLLGGCKSAGLCEQVHCLAVKLGVEKDVYVATSLVTVYSGCGEMVLATRVFGETPVRNVVSYNALISGLLVNGLPIVGLSVFKEMRSLAEKPNLVTLASVISACASLGDLRFGRQVHGLLIKTRVGLDTMVGTALVDMYSKYRRWQCAYDLFNELKESRNLVTWNTIIAGLMLNGRSDNAVELFELLEAEGLNRDSVTWNTMISGFTKLEKGSEAIGFFRKMLKSGSVSSLKSITSVLPACASVFALLHGREIHARSVRMDIAADEFLATALVDLYMKCGLPSRARIVFDQFEIKPMDPAFWNALISGYGRNGEFESAIDMFDRMLGENVTPNSATFAAVLSACSHAGQVDKGCQLFKMMVEVFNLNPNSGQVGCMVDLLGRSGRVEEAEKLVQEMAHPPAPLFASLLGACKHHLNYETGEEMAMKLSELEPDNPSPFVILSNIYAELGRWGDMKRVRQIINDRGLRKLPGFSSIGIT